MDLCLKEFVYFRSLFMGSSMPKKITKYIFFSSLFYHMAFLEIRYNVDYVTFMVIAWAQQILLRTNSLTLWVIWSLLQ